MPYRKAVGDRINYNFSCEKFEKGRWDGVIIWSQGQFFFLIEEETEYVNKEEGKMKSEKVEDAIWQP